MNTLNKRTKVVQIYEQLPVAMGNQGQVRLSGRFNVQVIKYLAV